MVGRTLSIIFRLAVVITFLVWPSPASAQSYSFSLDKEVVDVYWESDGTVSIQYEFWFSNSTYGDPLDYVDVGLPNGNYNLGNVVASINGVPITHIADSPYVTNGVELGLGTYAIQPGDSGIVRFWISGVRQVLFEDSNDSAYASAVFSPTWFDSSLIYGTTDLTVTYHLPAGIATDAPRYHRPPSGWPDVPQSWVDADGRIIYSWQNPSANGYTQYLFGASFPASVVPPNAIRQPSIWQRLGIDPEALIGLGIFCAVGFFVFGIPIMAIVGERRRKLKYLPPKITLKGHGIKRGLTAIEAAVLLEQPMDKILTMILFAVIKKSAARIVSEKPLKIESEVPLPSDLRSYETEFLSAMSETSAAQRRKLLQKVMVSLIRSVEGKMKGFSHRETTDYYRDIMARAWEEVKSANTPEVMAEKFDKLMEWTMLDKDYEDNTRDIFSNRPIPIPSWYPRYSPTYRASPLPTPSKSSGPALKPTQGSAGLPHLPGSDFAASVVTGVQNFSAGVIGNLTEFTGGITKTTNPPPVTSTSSYRSGGGGSSCACACACAGCACACAGGGR